MRIFFLVLCISLGFGNITYCQESEIILDISNTASLEQSREVSRKSDEAVFVHLINVGGDREQYIAENKIFKKGGGEFTIAPDLSRTDSIVFKFDDEIDSDLLELELKNVASDSLIASFTIITESPSPQEEPGQAVQSESDLFIKAIKERFPDFIANTVYQQDNVIHVFVGPDLRLIPGTAIPSCNNPDDIYIIHYLSTNEKEVVKFQGRENKRGTDLVVKLQSGGAIDSVDIKDSQPIGPFATGVDLEVSVVGKGTKVFTVTSCSAPYHVSIMGGFMVSSLNNPTRITAGTRQDGQPTLFADNASSQKVISLMAVFYPNPRDPYYSYRDLSFWDKWCFGFGTKISEDIFDDFFLSLNYEFSKGGNFTGGVHYGEHTVIQGYEDFDFGKDVYAGNFTNNNTNLKYDFGFFLGLVIDLRVVTGLRDNTRNEHRLNQPTSTSPNGE